jgi:hypothetical protein
LAAVLVAAILIWSLSFHFRGLEGPPRPWFAFVKGVLLLFIPFVIYGSASSWKAIGLHFLPLGWLASSRALWDISVLPESRFGTWLALFLLLQVLVLLVKDGRLLLPFLLVIWGGLSWLFKISFLLPLAFLGVSSKGPYASWLRWGGVVGALGWFLAFRGHNFFSWKWEEGWDLWIDQRLGIFLLLVALGSMDLKFGALRQVFMSYFLLVLGSLIWGGSGLIGLWQADLLTFLSILYAGFGYETLRRELLGEEWFHRWMGTAIGVALWGSVL